MQAEADRSSSRNNPLVTRDRRLGQSSSVWTRDFDCQEMSILIVCRGPIRKEAIDVFREMGIDQIGILLSEKDSIVYPRALSPELRIIDPAHVHSLPDYSGATKEERLERIEEIIRICRSNRYEYVFAGYGFMAEDAAFVGTLEDAGLRFIGPGSFTQRAAGAKDEAKRTAIQHDVSVTPGINNATALTLLRRHPDRAKLEQLVAEHDLEVASLRDDSIPLEDLADDVLNAAYAKRIDLYSVEDLTAELERQAEQLIDANPNHRFRLKAIGGGGGKGQRIFSDSTKVPALAREVLSEVKTTGVGDNKNILIEINIEETRHNEIQIIGNGAWCISLGGRDCSLQMHEQKLVEVSTTREGLGQAIAEARSNGNGAKAEILEKDRAVLIRMEEEAERFGSAVKLDSASTFECIVEGERHYFMEVNTRIQVEHRVSELCYALRFTNPDDADDYFEVHSLVEAMTLVAHHKTKLPRPTRTQREMSALEVRLNATDRALSPHAGGTIISWSDPIDCEIRDDQGISIKSPDSGLFMRYYLAGAYDSNIALLLATGQTRHESFAKLAEILRRTTIRGVDLATNLEFHLGLVAWFTNRDVFAKPTTKFVVPYLTLVGELAREARAVDFDHAFKEISKRAVSGADAAARQATQQTLALKETLLERPIGLLVAEPHYLSAWLSQHRLDFGFEGGHVRWDRNPLEIVAETYHLLHLDDNPNEPAAHRIWDHDQALLETGLAFYRALGTKVPPKTRWPDIDASLQSATPSYGFDAAAWDKVQAAHRGHQLGLKILELLPLIAKRSGFFDLELRDDLGVTIPERLHEPAHQDAMRKILVPPPATSANEIVAAMGGTYYPQEAPGYPLFVTEGQHFEKGDPLYIIEVMKMFNKVTAPFAGTIDNLLIGDSSVVVRKGQPLFKVTPDETIVPEDPRERAILVRTNTDKLLAQV